MDYLERLAAAKIDIARLKGDKEAFEQSNAPDDLDEGELKNWNYAKDLNQQIRELKAENKDALKALIKLEKAAAKPRANVNDKNAASNAKTTLQPVLVLLTELDADLVPYEEIKTDLAAARSRYRELTDAFVGELKVRCDVLTEDQKRFLVLDLLEQDVQAGLNSALVVRRQDLVQFVERLWDKYRVTLNALRSSRQQVEITLLGYIKGMAYE